MNRREKNLTFSYVFFDKPKKGKKERNKIMDKKEKEQIFKKLQSEINQSIADMEKGIYFTREELNKRYGL